MEPKIEQWRTAILSLKGTALFRAKLKVDAAGFNENAKELVLFCVAASHPSRFPAAVCFSSQFSNERSLVSLHRHMFASHCLLFVTPPLICLLLYLGPVALGITSWQVTSNCPASLSTSSFVEREFELGFELESVFGSEAPRQWRSESMIAGMTA